MSIRCSRSAIPEPLAGTAPAQTHWLFVEAPGAWGRQALTDCSLPEGQRRALAQLPDHWRVILVRRPDRPLRRQRERLVWLSAPDVPVKAWQLDVAEPVVPDALPGPGVEVGEQTLFICTNGSRDPCCAQSGRALFDQVADGATWECSHLGGHRFAPTAIRLPDRLVFGRLTDDAARDVLRGTAPLDAVRGPAGWSTEVQAAAVSVWRQHRVEPLRSARSTTEQVELNLADGTRWQVPITMARVGERMLSCGAEPVAGSHPSAGTPQLLNP